MTVQHYCWLTPQLIRPIDVHFDPQCGPLEMSEHQNLEQLTLLEGLNVMSLTLLGGSNADPLMFSQGRVVRALKHICLI